MSCGPRAKFHLHPAESFFRDALRGAAPAGMNGGDGAVFCVGEQDGDAIGGLHGEQYTRFAGDKRVTFRGLARLAGCRRLQRRE